MVYGNLRPKHGHNARRIFSLDVSMLKRLRLHRETSLQFRFEAFNASNHPELG